jgi:hypothetical protein
MASNDAPTNRGGAFIDWKTTRCQRVLAFGGQ